MKQQLKITTMAAIAAAAIFSTAALAGKAKPVLLKVPVAFSTKLPALGTPIARVSKTVTSMSGGAVKMKVYEPGKLVAPFEILDAVSSGKVNAGYTTAGYWAGKVPASVLFSAVPFGPEAGEFMAWLYYGNGGKLYQEMYDQAGYNVKVLPCAMLAPETSGWFSKPIDKPEDLQGLRMRFFGLGGKVLQKLGVSTSLIPGGEIFPALEKGAIDATEFSMPAIDAKLGFSKVVKYNYFPGWHQQATLFELLINKDTWTSMDKGQQAAVETVCKASMADSFAEGEAIQFSVLKDNVENKGVQIRRWSPEMLALFEKTWQEVVEEERKDPFFDKVWQDLSKFRNGYNLWEQNAFLPRGQL